MDLRVWLRYVLRVSEQVPVFEAPSPSVQDEGAGVSAHNYMPRSSESFFRSLFNSFIEALVSQIQRFSRSSELVEDVSKVVRVERRLAPLEDLCIISLAYKPSQQALSYSISTRLRKPLAFI